MLTNSNPFFESLHKHVAHSETFSQAVELCEEQLQDKTMRVALAAWAKENSDFAQESPAIQRLIKKATELDTNTENSSASPNIEFRKFINDDKLSNTDMMRLEQGDKTYLRELIRQVDWGIIDIEILIEYLRLGVITQENCKETIIQYCNENYVKPVFWEKVWPLLELMNVGFVIEILSCQTNEREEGYPKRFSDKKIFVLTNPQTLAIILPILEKFSGDQLFTVFSTVFPFRETLKQLKIRELLATKLSAIRLVELAEILQPYAIKLLNGWDKEDPITQKIYHENFSQKDTLRVLSLANDHYDVAMFIHFIDRLQDIDESMIFEFLMKQGGYFWFSKEGKPLLDKLSLPFLFKLLTAEINGKTYLFLLFSKDYNSRGFQFTNDFQQGIALLKKFKGQQFCTLFRGLQDLTMIHVHLIGSHPKEILSLISDSSLLSFAQKDWETTFLLSREIEKAFGHHDLSPEERERLKKMSDKLILKLFHSYSFEFVNFINHTLRYVIRKPQHNIDLHEDMSFSTNPDLAYYVIRQISNDESSLPEVTQSILAKLVKSRQLVMLETGKGRHIFPIDYLKKHSHFFAGFFQFYSSKLTLMQDLRDEAEGKKEKDDILIQENDPADVVLMKEEALAHIRNMKILPSVEGVTLTRVNNVHYPIIHLAEIITDPVYVNQLDLFLDYLSDPFLKPKNWEGYIAKYLGNDELPDLRKKLPHNNEQPSS